MQDSLGTRGGVKHRQGELAGGIHRADARRQRIHTPVGLVGSLDGSACLGGVSIVDGGTGKVTEGDIQAVRGGPLGFRDRGSHPVQQPHGCRIPGGLGVAKIGNKIAVEGAIGHGVAIDPQAHLIHEPGEGTSQALGA